MPRVRTAAALVYCAFFLAWGVARGIELGGTSRDGIKASLLLPRSERLKNTGGSDGPRGPGSGSGLCVFTSIAHAARWQNVDSLKDFQAWMRFRPGGGYPAKVDDMIARYTTEQGVAKPAYLQYEGLDTDLVRAAVESGRMPCVTYDGRDPHYRGHIEHMVNVIGFSDRWVVVLDNNFVDDAGLVWLTPAEFKDRFVGQGGRGRQGWAVVLLQPAFPPEVP